MQTIINWTRYDGTEATLPEEYAKVLIKPKHYSSVFRAILSGKYAGASWDGQDIYIDVEVGDLWAPWPTAPQE